MSFNSLSFSQAIYLDVDPEVASIVASLGDATVLAAGAGSIANNASVASLSRYTADSLGAGVGAAVAAIQADIGDPSTRTNLQSLEAMLGCPDVAASSINDLMAKEGADGDTLETLSDQLDSVALETTLGGLITTVGVAGAGLTAIGDTRMSYLDASIAAISLVVPDAAGTAAGIIGVAGASLTAIGDTRMGYLDASIAAISLVVPDASGTAAGLHGTTDSLIGAINDTETSSLHGKLGTDTEMADTSVFDMITANRTALETASLGVAGGSLAANAREGSLLRYSADSIDTVMDNIGTISNTTLADTLAASLGDLGATSIAQRLTDIETDTAEIGAAGAGLTAIGDTRMAFLDASIAAISLVVPDAAGTAAGIIGVAGANLSAIPDMALDSTVAKASVLGAAVGATISADIAAVKASVGTPAQASVLGAAVGVSISADIAAIKTVVDAGATNIDMDALIATVGVAGLGLSAIPDMALDSTVAKEASITTLDGVIDAGFLAGATSAESVAIQAVVDDIQANVGTISNTTLADTLAASLGDLGSTSIATRLTNIQSGITATATTSSYDYTDAGGEQTVVEITPGANTLEISGVFLDLVNMTQNGTIKVYLKIDGATYRELSSDSFVVATDSDGVWVDFKAIISEDFKVTYTEGADEAAIRAIPWHTCYRQL